MQYRKKDQDKNRTDAAYEQAPSRDGGDRPRGRGGNNRGRGRGGNDKPTDRGGRPQTASTRGRGGAETRDDRPGTRGGGRGRGGRGQDGNHGNKNYQGAGGGRRPIDPTSYQWKYRNEERPTFEKIVVAADTEIPALPAPNEIKTKPSKDEFDRKMRELDRIVEDKKIKNEEARHHRRIVHEGGKIDGSNADYRDQINMQGDEIKKHRAERRANLDKLNALKDRQADLEYKKQQILKNMKAKMSRGTNYRTEEEMAKAIKEK